MKTLLLCLLLTTISSPAQQARRRALASPSAATALSVTYMTSIGDGGFPGGDASSLTFSLTTIAATNGYITVHASAQGGGGAVSGVTFNGSAMTALVAVGGSYTSELYGLAVGGLAAGTYTVVVTFNYSQAVIATSSQFNNVSQSAPVGTAASSTADAVTTRTVALTVPNNGMALLGPAWHSGNTYVSATPDGVKQMESNPGFNGRPAIATVTDTTTGAQNFTVTTASGTTYMRLVGIPLNPP